MKKFAILVVAVSYALVCLVDGGMFASARDELFWDAERSAQEEGQKVAQEILQLSRPSITFAPWTRVEYTTKQFVELSVRAENICGGKGGNEPAVGVIHDALVAYAFGAARLRAEHVIGSVEALKIAGQDPGFRYAQKLAQSHYELANFSSLVLRAKTWDDLSALKQALERRKMEIDWIRATKNFELGRPKKNNTSVLDIVV